MWHMYKTEYYHLYYHLLHLIIFITSYYLLLPAIKKDKIMPLVATWRDLETIIVSEVRQGKTNII